MSALARPIVPEGSRRHPYWADVPSRQWSDWRWQLENRVSRLETIEELIALTDEERAGIRARESSFPLSVTPHYLSLFGDATCPVRRQAVPHCDELVVAPSDRLDPLAEEEHSPTAILVHRYPDRALLYVTHFCPVSCRHCTRQRKVGDPASAPTREMLEVSYDYLRKTPQVRDVLVSGGDPLTLSDARLVEIIEQLRRIASVEIIRLCTRAPVTLPQRISDRLLEALRPYQPIYVNTHFNHPKECCPEASACLDRLADAGFVVSNQMVLLRGVNDDADIVEVLGRWLLRHRCRPYYMFLCDPVAGTAHFRTPVRTGVEILEKLRGRLSGLAIPQLAIDLPGGGGKVTLSPDHLVREHGRDVVRRGANEEIVYVDEPG
jgi:lysine 2,3-aminomutase